MRDLHCNTMLDALMRLQYEKDGQMLDYNQQDLKYDLGVGRLRIERVTVKPRAAPKR